MQRVWLLCTLQDNIRAILRLSQQRVLSERERALVV